MNRVRCWSPSIDPSNMFIYPSPKQKETRSNTVIPTTTSVSSIQSGPKISFQEYVAGFRYTIEKYIDCRLSELFENPVIQRHYWAMLLEHIHRSKCCTARCRFTFARGTEIHHNAHGCYSASDPAGGAYEALPQTP